MTKDKVAPLMIIILSLLAVVIAGINYKRINFSNNTWNEVMKQLDISGKWSNKGEDQNKEDNYSIWYKNFLIEFSLPKDWISRLKQDPVNVGSTTDFMANDYSYVRLPNIKQDQKKAVAIRDGSGWLDVQIFDVSNNLDYEKLITELAESASNKTINPGLIEFAKIKNEKNIIDDHQGYVVEYNNKYYDEYIKNNLKDIDPVMDTWNIEQAIKLSDRDILVLSGWIDVNQVEKYKVAMEEIIKNVKITQKQ